MAILLDANTRLLVQGITGREGGFHTLQMVEYGTNVVAGVTPGKGGQTFESIPVFDSVERAVAETGANASIIFVPPPGAGDAMAEAASAGLPLVICITEGVPILDTARVVRLIAQENAQRGATGDGKPTVLIGPNCPGVMTPGGAKAGIMPANIFSEGTVGVISRSGTLTYEVVDLLSRAGLGVSTCVGIGGDPIIGTTFVDLLAMFRDDPQTEHVLVIGEIGGSDEETAAAYVGSEYPKDVYAFISGRSAPPGKRMGHAGAIISGSSGTPQAKVAAFTQAGVPVADTLADMVQMVKRRVEGRGAAT